MNAWGLGLRFGVQGLGFRVQGVGFRVWVRGSWFGIHGLGFGAHRFHQLSRFLGSDASPPKITI